MRRCEHYSNQSKLHLCYRVESGPFHLPYLSALFSGDQDLISLYENEALRAGYGPLADCRYTRNNESVKVNCRKLFQIIPDRLEVSHTTMQHSSIAIEPRVKCTWLICRNFSAPPKSKFTRLSSHTKRNVRIYLWSVTALTRIHLQ